MVQTGSNINGKVKPEVESVTSLLSHSLLQDPKFLAAVLGLLLAISLFSLFRPSRKISSRSGGPATVLLIGPSDGGKTSIFANITQNIYPQTHTSVRTSSTSIAISSPSDSSSPSTTIKLVDLPGHPRLRDEVTRHLKEASAVIFVVDIVGVVRNAGAVAEEIPKILTTLASAAIRNTSSSPPKILFLANKSDLLIRPAPPSSPSPPNIPASTRTTATERLKSILTREMDRLKSARSSIGGRIEGIGRVASGSGGWWKRLFGSGGVGEGEGELEGEDEGLIWGGKGGFRWDDVEGVAISWGSSGLGMVSVEKGDRKVANGEAEVGDGLDEVREFLWSS